MKEMTAFILLLALPALVAADINRLSLSPDLELPDTRARGLQLREFDAMSTSGLPVWTGVGASAAVERGGSPTPCMGIAPAYLNHCLENPDCRNFASAPNVWLHAPRMDRQRTVALELRPE